MIAGALLSSCSTFVLIPVERESGADTVTLACAGAALDRVQNSARAALVDQVAGSLLGGVRSPVLERAFDYWKSIDPDVGARIEQKVRAGSGG